jgi:cytochrome P450
MSDTVMLAPRLLPPGPTEKYETTEDLLAWMGDNFARYGDLYRASVYGAPVYVVSNPDYCERILRRNWRNYARGGQVVKRIALLLGSGLIASNGEFWASQRRMMQPAFSKGAIPGFTGIMTEANADLLARWRVAAFRQEAVHVTHDLRTMVLKITLIAIFGDDYADVAPNFAVLAEQAARNLEFAAAFRPLGQIIRRIIEQRRQQGREANDFLGSMMAAVDRTNGQSMPDNQLIKETLTLVIAGYETTAGLLNWIWYLLARHPDQQSRLAAELEAMPWGDVPPIDSLPQYNVTRQVIEEALRLYPPLWLMTRRAVQDDQLGDFFVPAGTEIYISPYLIQRNPDLWETPDRFDPDRMQADRVVERPELAMCPFGAGPRNCIGEHFARVETQIHLMMFARELHLRHDYPKPAEISTGMNLLSQDDFIMWPELRHGT